MIIVATNLYSNQIQTANKGGPGIMELGCMAHARRKFFDLHAANHSPIAEQALHRIAELYDIERQANGLSPPERAAVRSRDTIPKLAAYHAWLEERRVHIADNSSLAKAIDYSLRPWTALTRFASSGNLPIDNNPVENLIRPIAVGKKNWLFTGSERAGQRAAFIQSLLITAQLNGLDPAAWLAETLEKLPTWPARRLDELLPLVWPV